MRIIIASIGFVTILTGPWWVPLICMVLLCLRWQAIEALFIGLAMDFIWQGSSMLASAPWHGFPMFTMASILLLWGFEPLRRQFLT